MERITYAWLVIAAILLAGCTVDPERPRVREGDHPKKSTATTQAVETAPRTLVRDKLLNEPPENPRFLIAQRPAVDAVEQPVTDSIKRQLLNLGYVEADTRDDANVVVWYSYESEQSGIRNVGQPADIWGEQLAPVSIVDLSAIVPGSFTVQIISLQKSHFPGRVFRIWRGAWSTSRPGANMVKFTKQYLPQVFEQYQSEQTQNQLEAFRQARAKKVEAAANRYMKMVMYRIQGNWQKPKTNVKGKTCKVKIVQTLVGQIKSHKLLSCDRDRRFRKSIEKAIKASSPLPMPKQDLFDRRELILIFQG